MSEIARWDLWDGQMSQSVSGLWVRYAAHEFEVERLATELAEAHDRCRALELSVEQADEMKAHAEASAAAEEAETDRVTAERDAAQAEVERLTQELEGRRVTNQRVIAERDLARAELARLKDNLFPWDTYRRLKNANEHLKEDVAELTAERDEAQAEVERLRANCQPMLDSSRPTDETIWWKAFNSFLRDDSLTIEEVADQAQAALTIYRARWPR